MRQEVYQEATAEHTANDAEVAGAGRKAGSAVVQMLEQQTNVLYSLFKP